MDRYPPPGTVPRKTSHRSEPIADRAGRDETTNDRPLGSSRTAKRQLATKNGRCLRLRGKKCRSPRKVASEAGNPHAPRGTSPPIAGTPTTARTTPTDAANPPRRRHKTHGTHTGRREDTTLRRPPGAMLRRNSPASSAQKVTGPGPPAIPWWAHAARENPHPQARDSLLAAPRDPPAAHNASRPICRSQSTRLAMLDPPAPHSAIAVTPRAPRMVTAPARSQAGAVTAGSGPPRPAPLVWQRARE